MGIRGIKGIAHYTRVYGVKITERVARRNLSSAILRTGTPDKAMGNDEACSDLNLKSEPSPSAQG